MKLHQVADHYRSLVEALPVDPDTGEVTDEDAFADAARDLELIEPSLNDRVQSLGLLLVELQAEVDSIQAEAERLNQRAERHRKRTRRLESYLLACIDTAGLKRAGGALLTCSVRQNPPRVEITGEVPPAYMVQPAPPPARPDKRALKAALEKGEADARACAELVRSKRLVVS